jgi:hypothetical protein
VRTIRSSNQGLRGGGPRWGLRGAGAYCAHETNQRTTSRAQETESASLRARPTNLHGEAAESGVQHPEDPARVGEGAHSKRGVSGGELGDRGQGAEDKREPSEPVLPMDQARGGQAAGALEDEGRFLR